MPLLIFTNTIPCLHSTSCTEDLQAVTVVTAPKRYSNHLPAEGLCCCYPLTWYQVGDRGALINPAQAARAATRGHRAKRNWCLCAAQARGRTQWLRFKAGVQLGTDDTCFVFSAATMPLPRALQFVEVTLASWQSVLWEPSMEEGHPAQLGMWGTPASALLFHRSQPSNAFWALGDSLAR